MGFGKNIRAIRNMQHMTQSDLAKRVALYTGENITQGYVANLESRDYSTSRHAPAFAQALGVAIEELYSAPDKINVAAAIARSDAAEQEAATQAPAGSAAQAGLLAALLKNSPKATEEPKKRLVNIAPLETDGEDTHEMHMHSTLLGSDDDSRFRVLRCTAPVKAPQIKKGDMLIIETEEQFGIAGVYVIQVNDEIYTEALTPLAHGRCMLGSTSQHVDVAALAPHVIGRAVMWISRI